MTKKNKNANTSGGTVTSDFKFDNKGFEIHSPCGRAWFYPLDKVRDDYADYLAQADNLSLDEAKLQAGADEDFLKEWFSTQIRWDEVEANGTLIKEATPAEILKALNHLRNAEDDTPFSNAIEHNMVDSNA